IRPAQLPLPISLADAQTRILDPALSLLPAVMDTHQARVMLLAIALQESDLAYREQIGGPAHGLWMFERGGGVKGVQVFQPRPAHFPFTWQFPASSARGLPCPGPRRLGKPAGVQAIEINEVHHSPSGV